MHHLVRDGLVGLEGVRVRGGIAHAANWIRPAQFRRSKLRVELWVQLHQDKIMLANMTVMFAYRGVRLAHTPHAHDDGRVIVDVFLERTPIVMGVLVDVPRRPVCFSQPWRQHVARARLVAPGNTFINMNMYVDEHESYNSRAHCDIDLLLSRLSPKIFKRFSEWAFERMVSKVFSRNCSQAFSKLALLTCARMPTCFSMFANMNMCNKHVGKHDTDSRTACSYVQLFRTARSISAQSVVLFAPIWALSFGHSTKS